MIRNIQRGLGGLLLMLAVMLVLPATGMAAGKTYWAVVNANGSLARGTPGVQSARPFDGQYAVQFPKNVANCAWIASGGMVGSGSLLPPVTVAVTARVIEPKTLYVGVFDTGSHPVNTASFHLQVWCNPNDPWMTVEPNGHVDSHGGTSGTAVPTSTGTYTVTFDRPVNKCGYQATIANSTLTFVVGPLIEVSSVPGHHRQVRVTVRTAAGQYGNVGFHIVATCGKKKIWAVLPSPVTSGIPRGGHLVKAGTVQVGVMSAEFDVPIDQCSWVATIGGYGGMIVPQGLISTALLGLDSHGVWVETDDVYSNHVDRGAHLSVVC